MLERIEGLSRSSKAVVAIGRSARGDAADGTARMAREAGMRGIVIVDTAEALVEALAEGRVDAAVRGTLPADEVLHHLRGATRARAPGRAALVDMGGGGRALLLCPVGIDEGRTVEQRWRLLEASARAVAALGEAPRVAVMSKGRPDDAIRGADIARSIRECEELVRRAGRAHIDATATHILVERAVGECNVLVAPDGVTGNLTFRLLHYVAGHDAWGALALHLLPLVYVDTSRDKSDFLGAVRWARAAAAMRERA